MSLKIQIIKYLGDNIDARFYKILEFDSGCAMIDIDSPGTNGVIVIQAEMEKIGVSMISREPKIDFSLPDQSFTDVDDAIDYIWSLINNTLPGKPHEIT